MLSTLNQGTFLFYLCFYTENSQNDLKGWLGVDYLYMPQKGEELGEKCMISNMGDMGGPNGNEKSKLGPRQARRHRSKDVRGVGSAFSGDDDIIGEPNGETGGDNRVRCVEQLICTYPYLPLKRPIIASTP
jgi:hypothetical protein